MLVEVGVSPPAHAVNDEHLQLMMDADQTWKVLRNQDKTLSVSQYVVNFMNYEEGSCKL